MNKKKYPNIRKFLNIFTIIKVIIVFSCAVYFYFTLKRDPTAIADIFTAMFFLYAYNEIFKKDDAKCEKLLRKYEEKIRELEKKETSKASEVSDEEKIV